MLKYVTEFYNPETDFEKRFLFIYRIITEDIMRTGFNVCGCSSKWQNSIYNNHCGCWHNSIFGANAWGCSNGMMPFCNNFMLGGFYNNFILPFTGMMLGFSMFNMFSAIGNMIFSNNNDTGVKHSTVRNYSSTEEKPKELEPIFKNNEDNSLDDKVKDEMIHIANDAMGKYLKTGKFDITDLLIERVNAVITNVDFSDRLNMKSGTSNDYKNDDGKNVLVSDGTKLTLTFTYNNKEYQCIVYSDKIPENTKPKEYIDE